MVERVSTRALGWVYLKITCSRRERGPGKQRREKSRTLCGQCLMGLKRKSKLMTWILGFITSSPQQKPDIQATVSFSTER